MSDPDLSRFVSWVLRHAPESTDVELDRGGWMDVDALVGMARRQGREIDAADIRNLVADQPKPRFSLSDDRTRIRANYGHSVEIDLGLEPVRPPDLLFHGTARRSLASIREGGLEARGRQWVHLSEDRTDAVEVGARHGMPVVLEVRAARMADDGFVFLNPAPGFWLVEEVPPGYLEEPDSPSSS